MGPRGGRAGLRRPGRGRPRGRRRTRSELPWLSLSLDDRARRDPFADFARMRREMDELLGDFWDQAGYRDAAPGRPRFCPRVDVYYCGEDAPERAVVKVDLPGVDVDAVNLEVRGRALVITGERPVRETEGRTYQQVELPSGPVPPRRRALRRRRRRRRPRRPTRTGSCASSCRSASPQARAPGPDRARGVAMAEPSRPQLESMAEVETPEIEVVEIPDVEEAIRSAGAAARRAAGAAAARDGHLPRHADPARGRPGALDQARQRRPLRQPDAGDGRLQGPRERRARARRPLRRRRRRRRSRG